MALSFKLTHSIVIPLFLTVEFPWEEGQRRYEDSLFVTINHQQWRTNIWEEEVEKKELMCECKRGGDLV